MLQVPHISETTQYVFPLASGLLHLVYIFNVYPFCSIYQNFVPFSFFRKKIFVFWMWTVFKVFIEFVKMLLLLYVLLYLATRHVGS